jgi:hypothetical protein
MIPSTERFLLRPVCTDRRGILCAGTNFGNFAEHAGFYVPRLIGIKRCRRRTRALTERKRRRAALGYPSTKWRADDLSAQRGFEERVKT